MKKAEHKKKVPEIEPLTKPSVAPSNPEIIPLPQKEEPLKPSPEIIPVPQPEIRPIKETNKMTL